MKLFIFRTKAKYEGRPYIIAFPQDAIVEIQTLLGSENTYLMVNGIDVETHVGMLDELKNHFEIVDLNDRGDAQLVAGY